MPNESEREAFLASLNAGGLPGMQAPQAPEVPPMVPEESMADPADEQNILEAMQTNIDPTTQDGDVFFMDPEEFANPPKKGDRLTVTMRVQSIGSKIGLTPLDVSDISETEDDDSEEEDESES